MLLCFHGQVVGQRTYPKKDGTTGIQIEFGTMEGQTFTLQSKQSIKIEDYVLKEREFSLEMEVEKYRSGDVLVVKRIESSLASKKA